MDNEAMVKVYCRQSDSGWSFGSAEFVVHNHEVMLPESLANDVVFGMRDMFGFAPWTDEFKEKTEYSIPEGYAMADADHAIPEAERTPFLAEFDKHTAELEAEAAATDSIN